MDHLSSCYFCGTTLDDTLQDYRVVPVELRDTDDATTATLCQSCHGKLERLLAPVVEAAGEDGATLDARAAPAQRESDTAAADSEAGGGEADPLLGDVESNLVDIEDQSPTETEDGTAGDEDAGNWDAETVRVRHETDDSGTEKPNETDTGGGEDTDSGGDTDDGDQSETARTTLSALEYNKVMRLLQNREFPVDRREFVTVAANAYGLAEHECAEVIDLAIDRGLVGERDGQLIRPDSS